MVKHGCWSCGSEQIKVEHPRDGLPAVGLCRHCGFRWELEYGRIPCRICGGRRTYVFFREDRPMDGVACADCQKTWGIRQKRFGGMGSPAPFGGGDDPFAGLGMGGRSPVMVAIYASRGLRII